VTRTSNTELKASPSSLEAESAILGTAIISPEELDSLVGTVRPEFFYGLGNEKIWRLLVTMHADGKPIDATSLVVEAKSRGILDDVGGISHFAELMEFSTATPAYYVGILRSKWMARQLINIARGVLKSGFDADSDPQQLIHATAEKITQLQQQGIAPNSTKTLDDSIVETLAALDERSNPDGRIGLQTGFSDLDAMLCGFRPGQLIVLAARPRVGKSAMAINIAVHVSGGGGGVMFVSMEMSSGEQTERILASEASVDGHTMLSGQFSDDELSRVSATARSLQGRNFHFVDDDFDIDSIVSKIKATHRKHGLNLVIIDYLQLCDAAGVPENQRERAVAKISRRCKQLAQELSLPVLALSQLNRDLEKRNDPRPRLSDLRESGAIEQDANVVLFLHRAELHDPEDSPGEAEIIIAKNRSGPTGTIRLRFKQEFTRFENMPQGRVSAFESEFR